MDFIFQLQQLMKDNIVGYMSSMIGLSFSNVRNMHGMRF